RHLPHKGPDWQLRESRRRRAPRFSRRECALRRARRARPDARHCEPHGGRVRRAHRHGAGRQTRSPWPRAYVTTRHNACRAAAIVAAALVVLVSSAGSADAYIGPGAGFALLSSFLALFTTILAALATLLFWPFRMLWRRLRGGKPPRALI